MEHRIFNNGSFKRQTLMTFWKNNRDVIVAHIMYDLIYYYYIVYAASAAAVAKTTACNNIRNGVRNLLVYNIVLYIIYITRGVFYDVLETIKTFGEI